jgi:hypothetical protein
VRALRPAAAAACCALAVAAALAGTSGLRAGPDVLPPPQDARAAAAAGPPAPVRQVGPFRRTARDAYVWQVRPVTAARLGSSHSAGCPVAPADLRLVAVTHWGFDGRAHRGELVVHEDVATAVVRVFRALHGARFPVQRMRTVDAYGGDDDASMAANNTSAYNCRRTTGGTSWSEHAYGRAIDLDPVQNPYVRGTAVAPPAGRAYLDRSDVRPGMVVAGDAVVRAFAAVGWEWGGSFRTLKDYQHFSESGR